MNVDLRGEMWTSYLFEPVGGFVCKLFSFSTTPPNKTTTSEFNWIEFKLYHQSKNNVIEKIYYLNATTSTPYIIDKTGVVSKDVTVLIAKENSDDNDYGVYMLPTLKESITYLQTVHCNIIGFFKFNPNATFDIKASSLVDKIHPINNFSSDGFTLENGWVDYSTTSITTMKANNGIVEINANLKSGEITDGTVIMKITDVELRPTKPSIPAQCITWNGTTYLNQGNVRILNTGEVKIYGITSQPKRLDFHVIYFV